MNIKAVRTRPVVVNQQIVDMLEEWLERAKRGDLNGMTIVVTYADDQGVNIQTSSDCGLKHLGGLMFAQHRILEDI